MPAIATLLAALGQDLETVDGNATIQYTFRQPLIGVPLTISVPAIQTDFSAKEIEKLGGFFQYGDTKFIFEDNKLMSGGLPTVQKPLNGDVLVDSTNTTWEVLDAGQDAITLAWEVQARKKR